MGYGDVTGVSAAEQVFSMTVFVVGTLVYALVCALLSAASGMKLCRLLQVCRTSYLSLTLLLTFIKIVSIV